MFAHYIFVIPVEIALIPVAKRPFIPSESIILTEEAHKEQLRAQWSAVRTAVLVNSHPIHMPPICDFFTRNVMGGTQAKH